MGKAFKELIHYLDVTVHVIKMAVMTIVEYPSNIAGWMISNPPDQRLELRAAGLFVRSLRDLPRALHDLLRAGMVHGILRYGGGL